MGWRLGGMRQHRRLATPIHPEQRDRAEDQATDQEDIQDLEALEGIAHEERGKQTARRQTGQGAEPTAGAAWSG